MPRLYKKEIIFCNDCPVLKDYLDYYGETIEYVCSYKPKRKDGTGGRKIKETLSSNKEKVEIPKWCPLEKIE
jgi:hypothetical protein